MFYRPHSICGEACSPWRARERHGYDVVEPGRSVRGKYEEEEEEEEVGNERRVEEDMMRTLWS